MDNKERLQYISGRHDGAAAVAEEALSAIIQSMGAKALPILDGMEARLVDRFKNSEIPAEHEMKHAKIVKPVLEEISRLISNARSTL